MTSRALFLSLLMSLCLHIYGSEGGIVSASEHLPPFLAESTGDKVNVRAGQSTNFERLCQLSNGEEVVVLGKEYSWYKIQLPPSAKSFVSKDYVQYLGLNAGGVVAADVNIRAGAGIHHTVLGQLSKGEQIYIQEDLDEWYRIEPVAESYGWVSEKFLTYKSGDLSGYQTASSRVFTDKKVLKKDLAMGEQDRFEDTQAIEGQDQFEGAPVIKKQEQLEETPAKKFIDVKNKGIISVVGYVEPYEDAGADGIYYKIVAGGQPVCYIQGVNHMLGRFINHQVSINGTVNQKLLSQYSHPVIAVLKVRLML